MRSAPQGCTEPMGGIDGVCGRPVERDGACAFHIDERRRRAFAPPRAKVGAPRGVRPVRRDGVKKEFVTFVLEAELVAEAKRQAAERQTSFSAVIREAVHRGMGWRGAA